MKNQFFHTVVIWALVALPTGLLSCKNSTPPAFELELVTSPPAQSSTCPNDGAAQLHKPDISSVRLTFFRVDGEEPSVNNLVCDRLLNADDSGTVFYLDTPEDTHLHVFAEAFGIPANPGDATPLYASGRLMNMPFDGSVDMPRIFMALTDRMGCALGSMAKARAFHTVTALPGGYALVAGGLVATYGDVTAVGGGLLLTEEIEIYSSQTGRFITPVLTGTSPVPRAFHQAFFLPGADELHPRVLLLGGVAQGTVPDGNIIVKIRTGLERLRLTPDAASEPAPPMVLDIDLSADPPVVTRSASDLGDPPWPEAYFQASAVYDAPTGQVACVAGGVTGIDGTGTFDATWSIDLSDLDSPDHYLLVGEMDATRLGHTITLSRDQGIGLVWGGNLGAASPIQNVAERIQVDPAPPSASVMTLDASQSSTATPIPTAFHTATLLPGDDVLVVGGFVIQASLALNPHPDFPIFRIRRNGMLYTQHAQQADGFIPVGYHAAVSLPDGRVLITGGSPIFEPGQTSCPSGQDTWTCSVSQAWIYTADPNPATTGSLDPLPGGELQVPRFGHTMTVLSDGTVLVVGGLRRDGDELFTEASAEVYNPADGSPAGDVLGREPGTLYGPDFICPTF